MTTLILNTLLFILKVVVYSFAMCWGYYAIAEAYMLPRISPIGIVGITLALMTIVSIIKGFRLVAKETPQNLQK